MGITKFSSLVKKEVEENNEKKTEEREKEYNRILSNLLEQKGVSRIVELDPEQISEVTTKAKKQLDEGKETEPDPDRKKKIQFLSGEYNIDEKQVAEMSDPALDDMMATVKENMIRKGDPRVSIQDREEFNRFAHSYLSTKLGENYTKEKADGFIQELLEKTSENDGWDRAQDLLTGTFEESDSGEK